MKMSDSIIELASALSKAQGMIDDATKTGMNPAFRSKYADLAAVRAVIREPLAVNDLAIVQAPRTVEGSVEVETMLIHKSGEFLSETLRMPVNKWDAQGIGSGITYARRYGLMSILSIASEDDDGNAAVNRTVTPAPAPAPKKAAAPSIDVAALIKKGESAASLGEFALMEWWEGLTKEQRMAIPASDKERLKAEAAAAKKDAE
jgi:hypothetical protein